MASTFFGLTIAYTGLQAAQTSINVTSHNLANINNQSYTKETASIKAGEALRSYAKYGTLGAGVIVDAINQMRDSYYDEKYRNNYTNYGQYNVKDTYMSQIQNYLNEFTLKGYSTEYENFFAALNQLDLTPADTSAKNQLINNAKSMTDYFNTLATNLRNVQIDANNEIKDTVNQINSLAQSISSLNKQINQIQANYGNANDLKDERNALIDDLSKLVNISVSETDIGNNLTDLQITINGNSLVNGYNYHTLQTVSRDEPRNVSDAAGLYDIQWETGQPFNIYSTSLGGELKGLIDIRDGCNGEIEKYATTTDDDGNETYKTDAEGNILTGLMSELRSGEQEKIKVSIPELDGSSEYIVKVTAIKEGDGRQEILGTFYSEPFSTSGPVANEAIGVGEAMIYYYEGRLHLNNLEGYSCYIVNMNGAILDLFKISGINESHPIQYSRGAYIIVVVKDNDRMSKTIVVK